MKEKRCLIYIMSTYFGLAIIIPVNAIKIEKIMKYKNAFVFMLEFFSFSLYVIQFLNIDKKKSAYISKDK